MNKIVKYPQLFLNLEEKEIPKEKLKWILFKIPSGTDKVGAVPKTNILWNFPVF